MNRRRRARTRRRFFALGAAGVVLVSLFIFEIWPFQNRTLSTEPIAGRSFDESESRATDLVRLTAPTEFSSDKDLHVVLRRVLATPS